MPFIVVKTVEELYQKAENIEMLSFEHRTFILDLLRLISSMQARINSLEARNEE